MMLLMLIVKYDSKEEFDLEGMTNPELFDSEKIERAYMSDIYQNALKLWLPFLNKRGYLDALLPEQPLTPFMMSLMKQMHEKAQLDAADANIEEAPERVECAEE